VNIKDLGNSLGNSKIINLIFKPAGANMESRLRQWLMNPVKTLRGAGIQPGQTVLEVGCGTGFFTLPAAQLIGDQGRLIAMDVASDFITRVSKKVEAANLKNVQVIKRNALDTGLDTASIDTVLLAVWLFPVSGWVPKSILQSGLFTYVSKRNGVYNYRRC
jgi:demethylmenaquinone methyltransferase/2-methoxy-6-polyprenyl-1,4-benzoquinol methylase